MCIDPPQTPIQLSGPWNTEYMYSIQCHATDHMTLQWCIHFHAYSTQYYTLYKTKIEQCYVWMNREWSKSTDFGHVLLLERAHVKRRQQFYLFKCHVYVASNLKHAGQRGSNHFRSRLWRNRKSYSMHVYARPHPDVSVLVDRNEASQPLTPLHRCVAIRTQTSFTPMCKLRLTQNVPTAVYDIYVAMYQFTIFKLILNYAK